MWILSLAMIRMVLLWRQDREVAQIVAVIVPRILREHRVERVYRHRDSGIADRMDSELPSQLVGFLDVGVDLLGREESPAAEIRAGLCNPPATKPWGR